MPKNKPGTSAPGSRRYIGSRMTGFDKPRHLYNSVHTEQEEEVELDDFDELVEPNVFQRNNFPSLRKVSIIAVLVLLSIISIVIFIGSQYFLPRQNEFLEFEPDEENSLGVYNPGMVDGSNSQTCDIKNEWRFDCNPEKDANEQECRKRKCCWNSGKISSEEPKCFFSGNYTFYKWSEPIQTSFGLEATAKLVRPSPYPHDVKELKIHAIFETEGSVRIKIFDPKTKRFEIPLPYKIFDESSVKHPNPNYHLKFYQDGFQVFRKGTDTPLFDTTVAPMIYANQFLQFSTSLPSEFIYGIGETQDGLSRSLNWRRTVLWARGRNPSPENLNLYSAHPIYFVMEKSGQSQSGVFLANSNAMEVILQPAPAVTFRTIGGILDIRIFVGPTPADVMNQYTNIIGKPAIPPYWSLGFHLCRWNYGSLNNTRDVVENNIKAGIPLDAQWNDIDYMQNQNDFTFDKINYAGFPDFVKYLHSIGMHYVPMIDVGISGAEPPGTYPPYDDGISLDIFVKDSSGKNLFVGKVYNPLNTVWPDFSHPNIYHYWTKQFKLFHEKVPFDGAWLDKNEPTNHWNGAKNGCDVNSTLDNPQFIPRVDGGSLYRGAICPAAVQYQGRHYDLHNLFGTMESITTYKVMAELRSERPLVISRSTFPGQGQFGGHWTGDVASTWDDMRNSIPQILTFGLFGIPMVGADICGFTGNTTVELCKRWMQLGAFYPFSRNHNTHYKIAQDPASLGKEVIDASRVTLGVRYSLLPYFSSLFFHAQLTGEPVARAMFYEFPGDINTYRIETQFMIGKSILVIPVLDEGHTGNTVRGYLPEGVWFQHFFTDILESSGANLDLKIPENSIPILYRGGTIVLTQDPAQTTTESRKNKFHLHVYLSKFGNATGEFYWDDGVSLDPLGKGKYNHFNFQAADNYVRIVPDHLGYDTKMILGSLEIRGISYPVSNVILNSAPFPYTMDRLTRTLQFNNIDMTLTDEIVVSWST